MVEYTFAFRHAAFILECVIESRDMPAGGGGGGGGDNDDDDGEQGVFSSDKVRAGVSQMLHSSVQ
jgi:hypothetical protein